MCVQQASPKTYKQYGGSGLGLFISRELTELQGGQIGVHSVAGETTTFTFFVKAKRAVEPVERPMIPGCSSNSASPVAYSRKRSVGLTPTTHLQAGAAMLALEASAVAGAATLVDDKWKGELTKKDTGTQHEDIPLHVLVVEDNVINQRVMSKQLRAAGCTVNVANHGLECLNHLEVSTFCEGTTPLSIVLLDLEMPTMDGLTCIRHIRERQLSGKIKQHVPVIAVTANARSEQISAALSAGMDSVVTKPFRIPELMPQMAALVADVERLKLG